MRNGANFWYMSSLRFTHIPKIYFVSFQTVLLLTTPHGVTKAAIKYRTNRQYIYRWCNSYDGAIESLRDRSCRPHSHPNQHTPEEIKLITDMRRLNPHKGLVVFWVKLRQRGYTRSIPGLYRFLRKRSLLAEKLPNPKYVPKPYEQMQYPGGNGIVKVNRSGTIKYRVAI